MVGKFVLAEVHADSYALACSVQSSVMSGRRRQTSSVSAATAWWERLCCLGVATPEQVADLKAVLASRAGGVRPMVGKFVPGRDPDSVETPFPAEPGRQRVVMVGKFVPTVLTYLLVLLQDRYTMLAGKRPRPALNESRLLMVGKFVRLRSKQMLVRRWRFNCD